MESSKGGRVGEARAPERQRMHTRKKLDQKLDQKPVRTGFHIHCAHAWVELVSEPALGHCTRVSTTQVRPSAHSSAACVAVLRHCTRVSTTQLVQYIVRPSIRPCSACDVLCVRGSVLPLAGRRWHVRATIPSIYHTMIRDGKTHVC